VLRSIGFDAAALKKLLRFSSMDMLQTCQNACQSASYVGAAARRVMAQGGDEGRRSAFRSNAWRSSLAPVANARVIDQARGLGRPTGGLRYVRVFSEVSPVEPWRGNRFAMKGCRWVTHMWRAQRKSDRFCAVARRCFLSGRDHAESARPKRGE
jgi:hypothetical protein